VFEEERATGWLYERENKKMCLPGKMSYNKKERYFKQDTALQWDRQDPLYSSSSIFSSACSFIFS
jgi:hypothetical protein